MGMAQIPYKKKNVSGYLHLSHRDEIVGNEIAWFGHILPPNESWFSKANFSGSFNCENQAEIPETQQKTNAGAASLIRTV